MRKSTALSLFLFHAFFLSSCNSDLNKGAVLLQQGDFERAIVVFDRCIARDPQNARARLGLGKSLLQRAAYLEDFGRENTDDWEKAVKELRIAYDLEPDTGTLEALNYANYQWARDLAQAGDTLTALEQLKHLLKRDYANTGARNLAGIIYFKLGNAQTALELLHTNTVLDSTDVTAWYNLGHIYWRKGQYAAAHQAWFRAFSLGPEDKDVIYWMLKAKKALEGMAGEK